MATRRKKKASKGTAKKAGKKSAKQATKKGGAGKGTKKRARKTSSTASPAAVEGYESPETTGAEASGMEEGGGGESESVAIEDEDPE